MAEDHNITIVRENDNTPADTDTHFRPPPEASAFDQKMAALATTSPQQSPPNKETGIASQVLSLPNKGVPPGCITFFRRQNKLGGITTTPNPNAGETAATANDNQAQQPQPSSLPGAYPYGPPSGPMGVGESVELGYTSTELTMRRSNGTEEMESTTQAPADHDPNLAVANEVADNSTLPVAELEDDTQRLSSSSRSTESNNKKTGWWFFCILLIIPAIVLAVVFGIQDNSSDEGTGTLQPSDSPSPAPSQFSVELFILDRLPEETREKILSDEYAQAKAYDWMLQDPNVKTYPDWRILQRFALATLYHSTNGNEWTNNKDWLSYDLHECEWQNQPSFNNMYFVRKLYPAYFHGFEPPEGRCYKWDGKYQNLWLHHNNMVGTLPQELFLLSSLKTLGMAGNPSLRGFMPTQLGKLTDLQGLVTSATQLQGAVPSTIGYLSDLRIFVFEMEGTLPTELKKLTNLTHLGIGRQSQKLTAPASFFLKGDLPKLKWFSGQVSGITGTIPTEVGLLTTLQTIGLPRNRISGSIPSEVGLLTDLGFFVVHDGDKTLNGTLPSQLGLMTSATHLNLNGNQFSGTIPSEMGLLTKLNELLLERSRFTGNIPSQLGNLSLLYKLMFRGNNLTGPIPSQLGRLPSLGSLSFGNNSFIGTVPEEFGSVANPKLYLFDVVGNPQLSGVVPEPLCGINGTCLGSPLVLCERVQGLLFDCAGSLCGCGCDCDPNMNSSGTV